MVSKDAPISSLAFFTSSKFQKLGMSSLVASVDM